MTIPIVRLMPFVRAGGAWQMAADEVLLEGAAAGAASFRVYEWAEPTLSLGYFQPAAVRKSDPLLESLPYVRRASGGATLVHDRELTYALALPAGAPWQPPPNPPPTGGRAGWGWARRMHDILRDVFASYGVETRLCETERKLGAVLCFQHHTPDDLLLGSAKIVGSAQRKRHGAVLQHGGILLAQSAHTPALPGVAELTGVVVDAAAFRSALIERLAQVTGWRLETADWSAAERQRIEEVAAAKYADPAWNDKR